MQCRSHEGKGTAQTYLVFVDEALDTPARGRCCVKPVDLSSLLVKLKPMLGSTHQKLGSQAPVSVNLAAVWLRGPLVFPAFLA